MSAYAAREGNYIYTPLTFPHNLLTTIANASEFTNACTATYNDFLIGAGVCRVLS